MDSAPVVNTLLATFVVNEVTQRYRGDNVHSVVLVPAKDPAKVKRVNKSKAAKPTEPASTTLVVLVPEVNFKIPEESRLVPSEQGSGRMELHLIDEDMIALFTPGARFDVQLTVKV